MTAQSVAQGFHPGGLKIPKIAESRSEVAAGGGGGASGGGWHTCLTLRLQCCFRSVYAYDLFRTNTHSIMHIQIK